MIISPINITEVLFFSFYWLHKFRQKISPIRKCMNRQIAATVNVAHQAKARQ